MITSETALALREYNRAKYEETTARLALFPYKNKVRAGLLERLRDYHTTFSFWRDTFQRLARTEKEQQTASRNRYFEKYQHADNTN